MYNYDIFISYNPIDREWVDIELLAPLKKASFKICPLDLEPGRPELINREDAIANSRCILLVITPEWLRDDWNEYESNLIITSDPAGRKRKLIPLLLRPCELPWRLEQFTRIDLTQPSKRLAGIARLIQTLTALGQDIDGEDQLPSLQYHHPSRLGSSSLYKPKVPLADQNFVGRQGIIQQLLSIAPTYRVISILGIPGIGKTSLLRQIAAQLPLDQVFWYEFRPGLFSLDDVLMQLARFLISQSEANRYLIDEMHTVTTSELDKIELLINRLNVDTSFLFFDAVHYVEHHSALESLLVLLKERLQQGAIFLAGREQPTFYTKIDEVNRIVYKKMLDGLTVEETQAFFDWHGISLQMETVKSFHHRLGGLPLALKLAVALMAENLDESQLVELIDNTQEEIVKFLFCEMYEQLIPGEKALLALASLFHWPFLQDHLLEIYGFLYGQPASKGDFVNLQRRLLIQSVGKGSYQIHEMIRALALAFDNSVEQHRITVADYLAIELSDVYEAQLEAIMLYLEAKALEQAAELTVFMVEHSFIPYEPRLAETLLNGFKKEKISRAQWMWLAGSKGNLARFWRKFDHAEGHYRAMLNLAEKLQNKVAVASAFQYLGILHSERNVELAERYYLDSLVLKKELNNLPGQAQIYNNLASLYIQQGRFVDAHLALDRGLALYEEIGASDWQKLYLYGNMGQLYAEQEQWEKAAQFHRQTLQIAEEVGSFHEIALSTYNLGVDADRQGKDEVAFHQYMNALHIAKTHHLWGIEELIQIAFGKLYHESGRYDDAIGCFYEVARIQAEIDDKPRLATTYFDIGTFYWHKNEVPQALTYYENGIAIFEHLANNREKVQLFLGNIRDLAMRSGTPRQITNALKQLKNRLVAQPPSYAMASVYVTLGEIYFDALHQNRVGFACMQQAIILFAQLQEWQEQIKELTNLGVRYENDGQYAKALTTYTQAIEITESHNLLTSLGIAYYNRANCFAAIEMYSQAENDYQHGLNVATSVANIKLQDAIRHNLGETYRRQGRLEESLSLLHVSLEFAHQHNNIDDQIRTLNNLGLAYEAQPNPQAALNSFEAALTLCCQHYRKRDEANVLISLGNFYMEAHQPEQAKNYYGQALTAARLAEDTDMEEGSFLSLAYAHRQLGTFSQIEEDFKAVAERANELKHYGNLIKFLTLAGQINLLYEKEPDAAAILFEQALITGVMLGYSRAKQFIGHTEQPALVPEFMEIFGQICTTIEDALHSDDSSLARSFYDALLRSMQARAHWRESGIWIINYLTPIRSYLDTMPEKSLWAYITSTLHEEMMVSSQ